MSWKKEFCLLTFENNVKTKFFIVGGRLAGVLNFFWKDLALLIVKMVTIGRGYFVVKNYVNIFVNVILKRQHVIVSYWISPTCVQVSFMLSSMLTTVWLRSLHPMDSAFTWTTWDSMSVFQPISVLLVPWTWYFGLSWVPNSLHWRISRARQLWKWIIGYQLQQSRKHMASVSVKGAVSPWSTGHGIGVHVLD